MRSYRRVRLIAPLICGGMIGCGSGFQVGVEGGEAVIRGAFLTPSGVVPAPRVSHTATFSPRSNRMIIFGGAAASRPLGDVHVLTDAAGLRRDLTWINLPFAGGAPGARAGHSAAHDPGTDRMIVFGGREPTGRTTYGDVWLLLNSSGIGDVGWLRLTTEADGPEPRAEHSAAYDAGSNRMIVFGGVDAAGEPLRDLWVLNGANGTGDRARWFRLEPAGVGPQAYSGHSAIYDSDTKRMTVFGGSAGPAGFVDELWVLKNADATTGPPTWERLEPAEGGPLPRSRHTAVYAPASNRMIVFGGFGGSGALNDVWILDGANGATGTPRWMQLGVGGQAPDPRGAHSAIYIPQTNRMIIFGGAHRQGGDPLADIWVLIHADGIV